MHQLTEPLNQGNRFNNTLPSMLLWLLTLWHYVFDNFGRQVIEFHKSKLGLDGVDFCNWRWILEVSWKFALLFWEINGYCLCRILTWIWPDISFLWKGKRGTLNVVGETPFTNLSLYWEFFQMSFRYFYQVLGIWDTINWIKALHVLWLFGTIRAYGWDLQTSFVPTNIIYKHDCKVTVLWLLDS